MGQHYKFTMSAHCRKSIPILIWPSMFPGRKIPTTNQSTRAWCMCTRHVAKWELTDMIHPLLFCVFHPDCSRSVPGTLGDLCRNMKWNTDCKLIVECGRKWWWWWGRACWILVTARTLTGTDKQISGVFILVQATLGDFFLFLIIFLPLKLFCYFDWIFL